MKVLAKEPHQRDTAKLRQIIPLLKQIKFFAQFAKIDNEDYLLLLNSMSRVYKPKGSIVVKEGEKNQEFYILLVGKATVYISNTFDDTLNYAGLKKVSTKNQFFLKRRHYNWKIFFKSIPVFEGLTLNTIEKLFYLTELVKFKKGDIIFKQGDHAKGFYVVKDGIVSISKKVELKINNSININSYFDQIHHDSNDIDSKDPSDIDNFQTIYHLTVNDSKQKRKECRIKDLKSEGSGQFIGIEDAVLKYSKHSCTTFEYTAVCTSAEAHCFFFDKMKAYDTVGLK